MLIVPTTLSVVSSKIGRRCEFVFAENVDQFFVSSIYISKCNMDARNHNIFRFRIAEIEHVVDHLFFIGFDDTASWLTSTIVRSSDSCHSWLFVAFGSTRRTRRMISENVNDNKYKWCHDLDEKIDDRSITKRHLLCMQCSHRLWCDLPKDNNKYR